MAQVPPVEVKPPSGQPLPELPPLPPLPPPEQLLPTLPETIAQPEFTPKALPETLVVERFEFVGNTVFSTKELAKVAESYTTPVKVY